MAESPAYAGVIVSLQLCPGHRKPMRKVEQAEAVEQLGLKEDRHALPDSSRQILLIGKETLDELKLSPGEVKENITTAGIDLMGMRYGERLAVGSSVVLEVTKACTPCSRMEEIRPGLKQQLAGRRGMLARVLRGGIIRPGDTIVRAVGS
jgi:MOSC domain-containing protein YiiM